MGEVTNFDMGIIVGYVDKSGEEVIEVKYKDVSKIRNNTIVLVKDDKVGLLTIKQFFILYFRKIIYVKLTK